MAHISHFTLLGIFFFYFLFTWFLIMISRSLIVFRTHSHVASIYTFLWEIEVLFLLVGTQVLHDEQLRNVQQKWFNGLLKIFLVPHVLQIRKFLVMSLLLKSSWSWSGFLILTRLSHPQKNSKKNPLPFQVDFHTREIIIHKGTLTTSESP